MCIISGFRIVDENRSFQVSVAICRVFRRFVVVLQEPKEFPQMLSNPKAEPPWPFPQPQFPKALVHRRAPNPDPTTPGKFFGTGLSRSMPPHCGRMQRPAGLYRTTWVVYGSDMGVE